MGFALYAVVELAHCGDWLHLLCAGYLLLAVAPYENVAGLPGAARGISQLEDAVNSCTPLMFVKSLCYGRGASTVAPFISLFVELNWQYYLLVSALSFSKVWAAHSFSARTIPPGVRILPLPFSPAIMSHFFLFLFILGALLATFRGTTMNFPAILLSLRPSRQSLFRLRYNRFLDRLCYSFCNIDGQSLVQLRDTVDRYDVRRGRDGVVSGDSETTVRFEYSQSTYFSSLLGNDGSNMYAYGFTFSL